MTIQTAGSKLLMALRERYDQREAAAITNLVMENLTGFSKIDRILQKGKEFTAEQINRLATYTAELMAHKPVQYVLQEAWFAGLRFQVDEHVLIPRPETEELVNWLIHELTANRNESMSVILDVGTGSGCIPIALKKSCPATTVIGCDLSPEALILAQKNAASHQTTIDFRQLDFLDASARNGLPDPDILISNPPYIPLTDAHTLPKNVHDYEPHLALFVPGNDPLLFYSAIAVFAKTKLATNGYVYVEMHEDFSEEVIAVFQSHGFIHTEVRNDLQGKTRMLKATRLP